jgi:hypothetical protein
MDIAMAFSKVEIVTSGKVGLCGNSQGMFKVARQTFQEVPKLPYGNDSMNTR